MYKNNTVAVVVPAYNEEKQIKMVIETMPDFVDRIVVVNDFSGDKTVEIVEKIILDDTKKTIELNVIHLDFKLNRYNRADYIQQEQEKMEIKHFVPHEVINRTPEKERIILINTKKNSGVGAAIAIGYKWCKDIGIDCTAVMAGDGQMDPAELESICKPVIEEGIDYVKGNRLIHRSSYLAMPKTRYIGNSILSILTKIASGYWHVSDTQSGYTAISNKALNSIHLYKIYKSYGMPNDILVKLNIAFCTIKEVGIKPVYHIGEKSKMNVMKVIPLVSLLLFKSFFKRLWIKYLFRDFHPLFLLYHAAFLLLLLAIPFAIKILRIIFSGGEANPLTILAFSFLIITGFQSLLFAMWMDFQDNERLDKS